MVLLHGMAWLVAADPRWVRLCRPEDIRGILVRIHDLFQFIVSSLLASYQQLSRRCIGSVYGHLYTKKHIYIDVLTSEGDPRRRPQ